MLRAVPEGQQRVGVLAEGPRLLEELGADPAEVAASVGIDVRVLDDPENSMPFTAAGSFLQAAATRTGCAHFGLLVGQRGDTRSLGLVGQLMRNAPTLGRALQDLVDNQHRYVRGASPYLIVRERVAWGGYAVYQPGTEGADHLRDGAMAVGFNVMRELCGASPDEVLLSRMPPADVQPYRSFFRVPVRFDAEQSAFIFPASELERPVSGADSRMRATLEELVAKYWTIALPSVTDQIVRMLRPRVLFGDVSLEAVARSLAMHPRTLNRRLRAEHTTFRRLLNEARFDVAQQLLAGTRMEVSAISGALGYAEPSAFTHAFHRIAGAAPLEWRAGLAEAGVAPTTPTQAGV